MKKVIKDNKIEKKLGSDRKIYLTTKNYFTDTCILAWFTYEKPMF